MYIGIISQVLGPSLIELGVGSLPTKSCDPSFPVMGFIRQEGPATTLQKQSLKPNIYVGQV